MSSPRPKQQRTDYKKLPTEALFSLLEQTLPGFSLNLHHMGKGMPAMVNWRHTHHKLAAWEQSNLHMRCGTYPDFRSALVAILERGDAFDEFTEAERKKLEDAARRRGRRPAAPAAKPRAAQPPKKSEPEPEPEPILQVSPAAEPLDELALLKQTHRKVEAP